MADNHVQFCPAGYVKGNQGSNMRIGKLPNSKLKAMILDRLPAFGKNVLGGPAVGTDCAILDYGKNACVLTTDPITGAAHDIGRLAVHVACNDLAAAGACPLGLLVTALVPPRTSAADLKRVVRDLIKTANTIPVDIIGGHTEVTSSVNRLLLSITAVGRVEKSQLIQGGGARPGDSLVLTKSAGLEGTAIIARSHAGELSRCFGRRFVEHAQRFLQQISVVKEGRIAAKFRSHAMHDVTEGGVLGAVWEMAEASGRGVIIDQVRIPIEPETRSICRHYRIDPLRLISSGALLIAAAEGHRLVPLLERSGIHAAVIGTFSLKKTKVLVFGNRRIPIIEPGPDELYKVV